MSMRKKTVSFTKWLILLSLLAFPTYKIIDYLATELPKEKDILVSSRETPIGTKTPLGKILNAIDTKQDVTGARTIYEQEKSKFPNEVVKPYLEKFFLLHDKFVQHKITLDDFEDAKYFIKESINIKNEMKREGMTEKDLFRAQEVIPITVIKFLYNAKPDDIPERQQKKASDTLLDIANQYLNSIVGPRESLSVPGAIAICIYTKITFTEAKGGFLKANKESELMSIIRRIDSFKQVYNTMIGGEEAAFKVYVDFLDIYKGASEATLKEGFWDRWWNDNIPNKEIPGISINRK